LRRVVAHVFGDQVLLISNDPVLAFLWFLVIWLSSLFFSSSSFSFAQAIHVLVLPMHSSRGDCEHKVEMCPCVSFCDE
jgi:hypothetical protein